MEKDEEKDAEEELRTLQSLHASLLAMKELVSAVYEDYQNLSHNYTQLAAANANWKVIVKGPANDQTQKDDFKRNT